MQMPSWTAQTVISDPKITQKNSSWSIWNLPDFIFNSSILIDIHMFSQMMYEVIDCTWFFNLHPYCYPDLGPLCIPISFSLLWWWDFNSLVHTSSTFTVKMSENPANQLLFWFSLSRKKQSCCFIFLKYFSAFYYIMYLLLLMVLGFELMLL